jgi:hypothetical protein
VSAPVLSQAAAGLLRGLIARSGAARSDVLLTEVRSVDWRSLTFDGERHEIAMRFTGPGAAGAAERMLDGIEDHEFALPGAIVADITIAGRCARLDDGSVSIALEALTILSD